MPRPLTRLRLASFIGVLCSALAGPFCSAAAAASPYRFQKQIVLDALPREEIVSVRLDSDVYAATQTGFADLRITDQAGRDVSYLLQTVAGTRSVTRRETWPAQDLKLEETGDHELEIRFKLGEKDPAVGGIGLICWLSDFRQRIRVFGRRGEAEWQLLVPDGLIFDYSRYMDIRNRDVPLPPNDAREFRIVVEGTTADQESQLLELTRKVRGDRAGERIETVTVERRPFRIKQIELWRNVSREERSENQTSDFPVVTFAVEPAQTGQSRGDTRILVTTRREPATAFRLETTSRNFRRLGLVEVPVTSRGRTEWRQVGAEAISRIDFRDLRSEQLRIPFPETRDESYCLVIQNGDNAPLDITGVTLEGNTYELLFFATPGNQYALSYGSDDATTPHYDATALSASLQKGYQPTAAELGPQVANSASPAKPEWNIKSLLNNPLVLGTGIGLLVLVFGFVLYRAAHRIDSLPLE